MQPKRNLLRVFILAALTLLAAPYWERETSAADLLLYWADNSNNEEGFKIERKVGTTGSFVQIASVGPNITAYTDSNLIAGSTYCYRLLAFNASGSSPYSETSCGSISSSFTLAVTKTGTGSGVVTSAPVGINCGTTCSASFNSGSLITLTATPAAGSTFSGWTGTSCNNGAVTMNGNVSCTATFALQPVQSYTISVIKAGTGTGVVTSAPVGINCGTTCSASFSSSSLVTLTATPAAGSTFSGWTGTGCNNDARSDRGCPDGRRVLVRRHPMGRCAGHAHLHIELAHDRGGCRSIGGVDPGVLQEHHLFITHPATLALWHLSTLAP